MQEVARIRLRYKPCHCGKNVASRGIKRPSSVIAQDDLISWIAAVASVLQELAYILDIPVTAPESMLASGIVDADEKRLLARHLERLGI